MKSLIITLISIILLPYQSFAQEDITKIRLMNLDTYISKKEATIEGLKSNNAAKIIWASKYAQKKSPLAFVYLHGFGASQREGEPIMSTLSKKFQANVYMSRLAEHGIYRDNTFEYLTPENYMASAQEAINIGKQLGEQVIIVSTSTGGTLGLTIAANDADIKGVILYSPFIDVKDQSSADIVLPGAKEKFIEMTGSEMRLQERPEEEAKFWSTNYHVNGYIALITMLKNNMTPETFTKVKCPVFLAYYYKNEKEQDQVVSVAAMQTMYDQLGTAIDKKYKKAFPESGNHVIGCDLRSKDWQGVYQETVQFIDQKILKK